MKTNEIAVYKKDLSVGRITVTTQKQYETVMVRGKEIKDKLKELAERKAEMTKPMNEALKSVHDLFRPLETQGKEALDAIKNALLTYTQEEARKAEEARQKLADRVTRGTMKVETALTKMADIVSPEKTVVADGARSTTVKTKAYRVTDKTKIPLEFLEPNMVEIKASFKSGKPVAGIEEYVEENVRLF